MKDINFIKSTGKIMSQNAVAAKRGKNVITLKTVRNHDFCKLRLFLNLNSQIHYQNPPLLIPGDPILKTLR